MTKQIGGKPKYKWPRKKEEGRYCHFCKRSGVGLIRKYGLSVCRRCFKVRATDLGFSKYG